MNSMMHDVIQIVAALREAQSRCEHGLERRAASLVVENCYGVHLGPGVTGRDVLSVLEHCGYVIEAGDEIQVVKVNRQRQVLSTPNNRSKCPRPQTAALNKGRRSIPVHA
jgi:hypothetical protein